MVVMTGLGENLSCFPVLRTLMPLPSCSETVTGTSIGYFASRAYLHNGMRHLQEHQRIRGGVDEMTGLDLQAGNQRGFEGGVAGLSDLHDAAHSTRGDH